VCHPHAFGRTTSERVDREDVAVPLPGGESMPGALLRPEGEPVGAVVLVPDIYGMTPFYLGLAGEMARDGLLTLVVDYFFREGDLREGSREEALARKQRCDEVRSLQDVGAALDWLRLRSGLDSGRTGVLGFCLGGTLGLDLAAERSDLAVVSYYGFPASMPGPKAAPAPIDLAGRISGPILAFWGDRDPGIPKETIDRFAALMAEHRADYEHTVYPGLGHGFLAGLADGSRDDHEAAEESWRRALDFFRRELGAADGTEAAG
jgi:carboxymethylenebutenolidase